MRRAKIICTMGPSTSSQDTLERMIEEGMDVARINLSHGERNDHKESIRKIRSASKRVGKYIAILQDLQGPKIRAGKIRGGQATLKAKDEFVITSRPVAGTSKIVSTSYKSMPEDVKTGDTILIDDGMIELKVEYVDGQDIICQVVNGGILKDHKGINLPGVDLDIPSITEKDREDLLFGIDQGVDYVGISFVRRAQDVSDVKKILDERGADIPAIAKLEKPEAIENLDEILEVADGVMIARGDLGVEMSPEQVPVVQKEVISKANLCGVVVITATQMLESMTANPRPTRAEASDVANAIFDGTDALMLSGETAVGSYPVESLKMMSRIIAKAEESLFAQPIFRRRRRSTDTDVTFEEAVSEAASIAAEELKARAIVAFTQSGSTARSISKERPHTPIIAFTPHENVQRRLSLYWGVIPRTMGVAIETDSMVQEVESILLKDGSVARGDVIVIIAGSPITSRGGTNLLRLHKVQ